MNHAILYTCVGDDSDSRIGDISNGDITEANDVDLEEEDLPSEAEGRSHKDIDNNNMLEFSKTLTIHYYNCIIPLYFLFFSDQVMPLPENWPKIPQIFQKRSWNFSTAVSPTINKATSHLELLQNIVEEYCKEANREILSRASPPKPVSRGPSQGSFK